MPIHRLRPISSTAINTVWTLVAAALVFGMQAGFVMLEAGFARKRETVNVLIECVLDTAICGISFWAIGYAFMFSEGNGFIGQKWFFLQGAPADLWCNRRSASCTLGIPVRICRYRLDHYIRRHDRPYQFPWRYSLQHWCDGLHLSDHRSLGMGAWTDFW